MKISYNWLKEYLNLDMTAEKTADLLTDIGLEVESIDLHEEVRGGLKGVVIGEVIQKRKHPNADRLALAVVDIGLENPLNIVCGAPNLREGQKVPVATILHAENCVLFCNNAIAFCPTRPLAPIIATDFFFIMVSYI